MTLLSADTTAIKRLRIRRADSGGGNDDADQIARRLQQVTWPQTDDGSWVFIRKVTAKGDSRSIGRRLTETARSKLHSNDPDTVRFADLTTLLTALLSDIVDGRAADKWYWRHWRQLIQQTPARAVAALINEHLQQLPAISVRLARQQKLKQVWLSLEPQDARQLLQRLAQESGVSLPNDTQLHEAAAQSRQGKLRSDYDPTNITLPAAVGPALQRWAGVIEQLPLEDPRLQTALLLIGRETAPLRLRGEPVQLLGRLADLARPGGYDSEAGAQHPATTDEDDTAPATTIDSTTATEQTKRSDAQKTTQQAGDQQQVEQADDQTRAATEPNIAAADATTETQHAVSDAHPDTNPDKQPVENDTNVADTAAPRHNNSQQGTNSSQTSTATDDTGSADSNNHPANNGDKTAQLKQTPSITGNTPETDTINSTGQIKQTNGSSTTAHEQSTECTTKEHGAAAAVKQAPSHSTEQRPSETHAAQQRDSAPQPHPSIRIDAPLTDREFEQFTTQQGGLFYLLNFLNRDQCQNLLEHHWPHLDNGWAWLYHLGCELGLKANDPLTAFIARQLGFEESSQLQQLPPLPAKQQLLALAELWYGAESNPDTVWQPQLLQLDCRIQASPSHIDIYAPLNVVQLPVRLAGLDVNPGWLPWLGRVVHFYYD